jgi:hypothetical protein
VTEAQEAAVHARFSADIAALTALVLWGTMPAPAVRGNALALLNGLVKGASASPEFAQSLYALAYSIPMELDS